jgi:DNA-binding PadR family transcriptional regulator
MNQYKNRTCLEREKMTENFKQELVQRIIKNLLDVQVLRLICTQPTWGYNIKKQVETDFGIRLRHSTLYPLLNEMEQKGFLTSRRQQQKGRTRKVYEITQKGKHYVETYSTILKDQIKE